MSETKMTWQPIETAQKRFSHQILLALPGGKVVAGCWGTTAFNRKTKGYNSGWTTYVGHEIYPTHWMPFPEPPPSPTPEG